MKLDTADVKYKKHNANNTEFQQSCSGNISLDSKVLEDGGS